MGCTKQLRYVRSLLAGRGAPGACTSLHAVGHCQGPLATARNARSMVTRLPRVRPPDVLRTTSTSSAAAQQRPHGLGATARLPSRAAIKGSSTCGEGLRARDPVPCRGLAGVPGKAGRGASSRRPAGTRPTGPDAARARLRARARFCGLARQGSAHRPCLLLSLGATSFCKHSD